MNGMPRIGAVLKKIYEVFPKDSFCTETSSNKKLIKISKNKKIKEHILDRMSLDD